MCFITLAAALLEHRQSAIELPPDSTSSASRFRLPPDVASAIERPRDFLVRRLPCLQLWHRTLKTAQVGFHARLTKARISSFNILLTSFPSGFGSRFQVSVPLRFRFRFPNP